MKIVKAIRRLLEKLGDKAEDTSPLSSGMHACSQWSRSLYELVPPPSGFLSVAHMCGSRSSCFFFVFLILPFLLHR